MITIGTIGIGIEIGIGTGTDGAHETDTAIDLDPPTVDKIVAEMILETGHAGAVKAPPTLIAGASVTRGR